MRLNLKITDVHAREVLDSRGNPTVEAEVTVQSETNGKESVGRAMVPSGASTGRFEAVELRDAEKRYFGLGVTKAIENVNTKCKDVLLGLNAMDQRKIDKVLLDTDGTENKENLGANATLSVSMATARAVAEALHMPLYKYLGGCNSHIMPVPMMNILNGGAHTSSTVDFQEFMIMPVKAPTFSDGLRICAEIYHNLKKILKQKEYSTGVGDEGGFAPDLKDAEEVLDQIMEAIKAAGYTPGEEIMIALDVAASELYNEETGMYHFPGETKRKYGQASKECECNTASSCGCNAAEEVVEAESVGTERAQRERSEYQKKDSGSERTAHAERDNAKEVVRDTAEMIAYYEKLIEQYPIISIEDGLSEDDWDGWKLMTERIGNKVQLVGDDLFVTNTKRLEAGIKLGVANAILVKVNQIGTLTEAMEAIGLAMKNNYKAVISHRSGETEDTFIADLAVAANAGQIKTGAPCRGERTAKYNELLRIEEQMAGNSAYHNPFDNKNI